MRLVTYDAGQGPRVGILDGDAVLDAGFDGDMTAFIEAGTPVGSQTPVENVHLLSPLRPRSMRDFLAFEGHLKNAFRRLARPIPSEWYEVPAFYRGMPDTVIGPEETVPYPPYTEKLDHELELAAIIGRRGIDVPREEANSYVFGYTIWNDLSARDTQARELPVGMGPSKAKDLIFSGRFVDADEALAIGLVDEVVPDEQVYEAARRRLQPYVDGPAYALRAAKEAVDRGLETDLVTGLEIERMLFAGLFATRDREIGMTSFVEQGPGKARFEGR